MSYREQFIAAWVTQQQRAFHQSTRGIMTPEDRQILEDEAEKAMAEVERDAALAAVERVRVIHARDEHGLCVECSWEYPETSYDALSNDVSWPCPTVAALDGAPEPEAERDAALARIAELENSYRIVERLYKIERQERIEAEARIAEAAKHPAAANCMFSWRSA